MAPPSIGRGEGNDGDSSTENITPAHHGGEHRQNSRYDVRRRRGSPALRQPPFGTASVKENLDHMSQSGGHLISHHGSSTRLIVKGLRRIGR